MHTVCHILQDCNLLLLAQLWEPQISLLYIFVLAFIAWYSGKQQLLCFLLALEEYV